MGRERLLPKLSPTCPGFSPYCSLPAALASLGGDAELVLDMVLFEFVKSFITMFTFSVE